MFFIVLWNEDGFLGEVLSLTGKSTLFAMGQWVNILITKLQNAFAHGASLDIILAKQLERP